MTRHRSPPMPLPTRTRLLSAPPTPRQLSLFPMPPLAPLPPTPTSTRDSFTHTDATLLLNVITFYDPPHLAVLHAPSCHLIGISITISTRIYGVFQRTGRLEPLRPPVRHLNLVFKSLGKRTKTLRSAVFVCRNIEDLKIEGEADEEC
ncbi:uncharacterized protein ARMOST_21549 [Armillaria ostoyae]|uniref:Uncharacterized protein n=1 Tax=Armillaria ostoyae TaxID=47428 RepID=A0A284SAC2_ARMOS|nr:uncharacterized protein ARMOST_21549 [Armillaria ostoyae]